MSDSQTRLYATAMITLFQPDELAAYEFRKTLERKSILEPEKRLMFAVLEDAILCFQRYINATARKERQIHQDAAAWIFDAEDNRMVSFKFVCDICGFDAEFMRMGLRKWSKLNALDSASLETVMRAPGRGPQRSRLRY